MLAALLALPGAAAAQAGAPLESQASGLFINAAGILTAARGDGLRVPVCAEGRAGAPGHRGGAR